MTPSSFSVQRIVFPETKEAIEKLVAESYANCALAAGVSVSIVSQNDTSDFDFDAEYEGQEVYLELTEIAPLSHGGYDAASPSYEIISFADTIAAQIRKKAAKYAGVRETPIILLLYSTDWRFSLADQALEHLQYLMHDGKHGLERIELVSFRGDGSAQAESVFPPLRKDWSDYDPTQHKNEGIVFADLSKPLPRSEWPGNKNNASS
ncbi:MAG: hypothetical protein O3C17_26885 [Planctomycetota bacterium]|nr:hypothetical protein [Planctomycetota bacterium]